MHNFKLAKLPLIWFLVFPHFSYAQQHDYTCMGQYSDLKNDTGYVNIELAALGDVCEKGDIVKTSVPERFCDYRYAIVPQKETAFSCVYIGFNRDERLKPKSE